MFFPNDKKRERLLLMGDARLLIVAGSDTTATTLVYFFYHAAKDPSIVDKLRAELREHNIKNDDTFEVQPLQYLTYLNALINETLRMHPPVPGGVFRDTPAEGVMMNGIQVPGGVKIIGPTWTIQRCKHDPIVFFIPLTTIQPPEHSLDPMTSSQSAGPLNPSSSSRKKPGFPSQWANSAVLENSSRSMS